METIILIIVILLLLKLMGIYDEFFGNFFKKHPKTKVFIIIILVGYIVIDGSSKIIENSDNIISFLFPVNKPDYVYTNDELRIKVNYLVDDLMDFVIEREIDEPDLNWSKDFWERNNEIFAYEDETSNIYYQNYVGDVNICYSEFKKRDKNDWLLDIITDKHGVGRVTTNDIRHIVSLFSTWKNEL